MIAAGIVGTGLYVPQEKRTNEWFNKFDLLPVDDVLDDAGVVTRRICAESERASDMEVEALLAAVKNAEISINDIDLILDGPTLHDQSMPGNAARVQYKSGAKNAAAINVESACTSLISQIVIAQGLILSGAYKTIACVTSTDWTKAADYTEKNCMLLGDGAAALIMQPVSEGKGILGAHLETDGSCWGAIGCNVRPQRGNIDRDVSDDSPEETQEKVYFYVDRGDAGIGEIKNSGPTKTPAAAKKALSKAGYTEKNIDFLICHNPTISLVDAWRKDLGVEQEKTYTTIEKYGNMSGASMGANLHEAVIAGKIKDGNLVVMCAPGAGYHYAAVVMRWGK